MIDRTIKTTYREFDENGKLKTECVTETHEVDDGPSVMGFLCEDDDDDAGWPTLRRSLADNFSMM